jgi:hypothetical protein
MTSSEIDNAILAVAQPSWRKVAMIIATTAKKLGNQLPDDDSGYQLIVGRVEALVREGRLLAQGDVTNWRFSEIRLPS